MYIAEKEDDPWKKIYFHTRARNKNKYIFLHLERDGWEKKLCGFKVLCVHIGMTIHEWELKC